MNKKGSNSKNTKTTTIVKFNEPDPNVELGNTNKNVNNLTSNPIAENKRTSAVSDPVNLGGKSKMPESIGNKPKKR